MKVMVIVKASKDSEAGKMPTQQLLTEMGKFNEELAKAGILVDAAGLHPSSKAARVRFSGKERTVIDGPFAETKELIAGFWIWQVKSMEEAITWLKRCPNPMNEDSDIDIRPFFEMEDFGEAITPEMQERDAATIATTLGLNTPTFKNHTDLVIAGLNHSYTSETRINIPRQWEQFVPQAGTIPGMTGTAFYGVVWNSKPNCEFDYLTGIEVSKVSALPAQFTSLKIAASRYAVFAHTTHVSAIPNTIDAIWTNWVPRCGLKISKAPCFERYTSEFNPGTGMGGIEIWIPLE